MKKVFIFLGIVSFIVSILLVFSMYNNKFALFLNNQFIKVEVGDVYISGREYSNPFIETNYDTLRVVDIKDGYVKYNINNTLFYSKELKYFKHGIIKKID